MNCIPVQKNMRALTLAIALLLILGGVCYAVPIVCRSQGIDIMPIPFTASTLVLIVAAVYLTVRYRMTGFCYSVRLRGDTDTSDYATEYSSVGTIEGFPLTSLDFVVVKSMGARAGAMECVLPLSDLSAVYELKKGGLTKKTVRDKYTAGGFSFYDYTVTFMSDYAVEMVFADGRGGGYVGVIIEPDEKMKDFIFNIKSPEMQ